MNREARALLEGRLAGIRKLRRACHGPTWLWAAEVTALGAVLEPYAAGGRPGGDPAARAAALLDELLGQTPLGGAVARAGRLRAWAVGARRPVRQLSLFPSGDGVVVHHPGSLAGEAPGDDLWLALTAVALNRPDQRRFVRADGVRLGHLRYLALVGRVLAEIGRELATRSDLAESGR